jgi:hypothetical protein
MMNNNFNAAWLIKTLMELKLLTPLTLIELSRQIKPISDYSALTYNAEKCATDID